MKSLEANKVEDFLKKADEAGKKSDYLNRFGVEFKKVNLRKEEKNRYNWFFSSLFLFQFFFIFSLQ